MVRAERFGVFVDLGAGVHALVPRSELSWSREDTARPALPPGTAVTVRLLEVDLEGEKPRIAASLKQVGEDPWRAAAALFAPGRTLIGRVTRVAAFGAFVELTPGIEGLVHVSAMGGGRRVTHPSEVVRPGQEVEVAILAVDPTRTGSRSRWTRSRGPRSTTRSARSSPRPSRRAAAAPWPTR